MKKLSILAVIAIFCLGLTSCKKDYTCTCTFTTGDPVVYPIKDAKKKDAKSVCDGWNTLAGSSGSCKLD